MSSQPKKATLYLFCGLPCSGKTTFAETLAKRKRAILFSLDRLVLQLFPEEDNFQTHRQYVKRIKTVFFPIVCSLLSNGCNVALDFPCHSKLERDRLRQIVFNTGAKVQLYYLQANLKTITERIQKRNAELNSGEYLIPDWLLTTIVQKFEPPDESENPIEIELKW